MTALQRARHAYSYLFGLAECAQVYARHGNLRKMLETLRDMRAHLDELIALIEERLK